MSWLGELLEKNGPDPRVRLELGQQLLSQLQINRLPTDSTLLNDLLDLVHQWLAASNYKVARLALEILDVCIEVSGDVIAPLLLERVSVLLERLGDRAEIVREATAQLLIVMCSMPHSSPQVILEKISPGLGHKQWLVRVGVMQLLITMIENNWDIETQMNRLIPTLCKLLTDPTSEVRETASNALVWSFYRLGEPLALSVQKRQLLPEAKFSPLLQRYREAMRTGESPAGSMASLHQRPRQQRKGPPPPAARKPRASESMEEQENVSRPRPVAVQKRVVPSRPAAVASGTVAGSVSEDVFQKSYFQVPKVEIFSAKELASAFETQRGILGNPSIDWDRRVEAVKRLRSILISRGDQMEEMEGELKLLEAPLLAAVKDLRSQVVREACVTIAFYAERLGTRMSRLTEVLLPGLILLLQNSAKVMSSSAFVACSIILKLIPTLAACLTSKSKEIRRAYLEFVSLIIDAWGSHTLEKSLPTLCEAIRCGLNDADADVRAASRHAFQLLESLYESQAAALFQTLDPGKQRALLSGHLSRSSSNQSIVSERDAAASSRASVLQKAYLSGRSASEIDPMAARRAMQHHTPSRLRTTPLQPLNSISHRSPRTPITPVSRRIVASPVTQISRNDSMSSKSISQPGSRSNSPTSRLPLSTRKSRRSDDGSREQSPTRYGSNANRPLTGVGRREMERAVFDALRTRVNGGQYEDVEDSGVDRQQHRFDSAELSEALRCCASTQWTEKRDGLHALQRLIRQSSFTSSDLKRITDTLNRLFFDSNNKALGVFLETVCELVSVYQSHLSDWLYVLLSRLLNKAANELLPSAQTHVQQALAAVRSSFEPQLQLLSLCRFIQDPLHTHTVKVKIGILHYMHQLMEGMNSAAMMNKAEVRQAVSKLILWIDDAKSPEVARLSVQVLCDMFQLNASEFSSILATFPNHSRDTVYDLLKKHQRVNGGASAIAAATEADLVHHRLRETSAQINDFVSGAGRRAEATSTMNGRGGDGGSDAVDAFSMQKLNDALPTNESGDSKLVAICQQLSMHNERVPERLRALDALSLLTRDGAFGLWDQHFKTVLLLLIETLGDTNADIRANALRLLKELCLNQATRFRPYAELTVLRVLEAHREIEKEVLRRAEECAGVLATQLPAQVCLRVLNPVIGDGDLPRQLGAIKMLTKLLAEMSASELAQVLPDVVPGIVNVRPKFHLLYSLIQAYNSDDSGVRKASVLCLVVLHNGVGEAPLQPYLSPLNSSKIKLLKLYITRAQTSSGQL